MIAQQADEKVAGTAISFHGFPKEAFTFLSALARNNNRAWFEAHRYDYDGAIVGPALVFIVSMGEALKTFAPSVKPEPRVGGSLFRIHRDTRFSTDKSAYKTHVGIRLRDADTATSSKCSGPLFYAEFDAERLRLAVGIRDFDSRTLEAYRRYAADERGASELRDMVRRAERSGETILGEVLKSTPRGYDDQPPNELLKLKGLFICKETCLPTEIRGPGFVQYCECWFRSYGPVFHTLRDVALRASTRPS